jgi:hypothetical protein
MMLKRTIHAKLIGYVPEFFGRTWYNELAGLVQTSVPMLIGNEIDITLPVYYAPSLPGTTIEYDHAVGEVFQPSFTGAVIANVSAGTSLLKFPISGFGGMVLNNFTLLGQGHFYYVGADGTRYFDYGLDVGNYTVQLAQLPDQPCQICVPGFGFKVRFMQVTTPNPAVSFPDLFLQKGVFLKVYAMGRIIQSPQVVGWNDSNTVAPLSWAQISATGNVSLAGFTTYSGFTSTLDGVDDGVDALQLPAGTYSITFSDVFYQSQTRRIFSVGWNSEQSVDRLTPLCPVGGTIGGCPSNQYFFVPSPIQLASVSKGSLQDLTLTVAEATR